MATVHSSDPRYAETVVRAIRRGLEQVAHGEVMSHAEVVAGMTRRWQLASTPEP